MVVSTLLAAGLLSLAGAADAEAASSGVPILTYHVVGHLPKDLDCAEGSSEPGCGAQAFQNADETLISDDHGPCPNMGHSIDMSDKNGLVIDRGEFARQLAFLADNGYRTLSLDELLDDKRPRGSKEVVVTFDDGYGDNIDAFHVAQSLFQKAGTRFQGALFMVSDNVGCPGRLSLDNLQEMDRGGLQIYSHTKTHMVLDLDRQVDNFRRQSGASPEDFRAKLERREFKEMKVSQAALKDDVGHDIPYLALPQGIGTRRDGNPTTRALARHFYRAVFTLGQRAYAPGRDDPYEIPRFIIQTCGDFAQALGLGVEQHCRGESQSEKEPRAH